MKNLFVVMLISLFAVSCSTETKTGLYHCGEDLFENLVKGDWESIEDKFSIEMVDSSSKITAIQTLKSLWAEGAYDEMKLNLVDIKYLERDLETGNWVPAFIRFSNGEKQFDLGLVLKKDECKWMGSPSIF